MSNPITPSKPHNVADRASDDRIAKATRDQLVDCARFLAAHIAQYHTRFGAIPFDDSAAGVGSGVGEAAGIGQGEKILLEALGRITGKDRQASTVAPQKARLIERRQYARIHVQIAITVSGPAGGRPSPAKLTDLSWGGASFILSEPVGVVGEEIQLDLPLIRGAEAISITSRILRAWDVPEGQGVAVRFSSLTPEDDKRLERVLMLLLDQRGSDRRKHPRLARRIEIEYTNRSDWQATLENISQGGMSLTVPYRVKLGQSVRILLSETFGAGSLTLRGRVVHEEPILFGDTQVYQICLEFEHPNEILQRSVRALLRSLAVSGKDELPRAVS